MGNHKIVVDGVTKDLQDDFSVTVGSSNGMGMPPTNNLNTELALQPGALIEGQTHAARNMTWNCIIVGDTQADFHDKRQAFIKALDSQTGKINVRPTGIEVQYTGATVNKKINVVYDGGLELNNGEGFKEEFSLRLRADDPLWKSTAADTTTALDSEDSATFETVAKRNADSSVDIWDNLGPPNASGTYTSTQAFADDGTYVYIGGDFVNFDNIAAADYIVRYHKTTGVFTALGTGMNNTVRALIISPDGTLYATGNFTTAGGGGAAHIASWNGSAWAALGAGIDDTGFSLAFAPDGTLYVTGAFLNAGGSGANFIASWDGSSWGTLGSGLGALGNSVTVASNGTVYVGGFFTTAGGGTANRIATYDGSWGTLGSGFNGEVAEIAFDSSEVLFAGGSFTTADGEAVTRAASWNGQVWSSLGVGIGDGAVSDLAIDKDTVFVSGTFTLAGGKLALGTAQWNGSGWVNIDISIPSVGSADVSDLHIDAEGSLWLGFDTTGTGTFSGDTTIAYAGTAVSYPKITIKRAGGTSAKIISLRNETTGAILYFDYDLLDGETLTLEFDQRAGAFMTSSFRGNVYSELLPNSNFGTFYLVPGNASGTNDNVITLFVDNDGATVTSSIIFTDNYISAD